MNLIALGRSPLQHPLEDHSSLPLLAVGFRPFFLLAAVQAAVFMPLWLLMLHGLSLQGHMTGVSMHAHEMIYGFTAAVIAGFLLTAGANWSDRRTTNAASLAGLSLLWIAGRLAVLFAPAHAAWACGLDVAFFPAVGIYLGQALIRSRSTRNYQFLAMLLVLTIANVLMHAEAHGWTSVAGQGTRLALSAVMMMILVMGGRVIPMFTRNGTQNSAIRQIPLLSRCADGAFLSAALLTWLSGYWPALSDSPTATAALASLWLLAGGLQLLRMRTWGTLSARPALLWILHVGFFATALSLVFEGLARLGLIAPQLPLHLFTVGGIGGLCLGMMTRVSLGHSGRMLQAPRMMTLAFALLVGATLLRVAGIWSGQWMLRFYEVSGLLWSLAFALLLSFGMRIWFSPRADSRN